MTATMLVCLRCGAKFGDTTNATAVVELWTDHTCNTRENNDHQR